MPPPHTPEEGVCRSEALPQTATCSSFPGGVPLLEQGILQGVQKLLGKEQGFFFFACFASGGDSNCLFPHLAVPCASTCSFLSTKVGNPAVSHSPDTVVALRKGASQG